MEQPVPSEPTVALTPQLSGLDRNAVESWVQALQGFKVSTRSRGDVGIITGDLSGESLEQQMQNLLPGTERVVLFVKKPTDPRQLAVVFQGDKVIFGGGHQAWKDPRDVSKGYITSFDAALDDLKPGQGLPPQQLVGAINTYTTTVVEALKST